MESLVVLLLFCFGIASCTNCQDGESFDQTRYCLVDGFMPWVNATAACSRMGGSLAVPNSPAEQTFLYDFAAQRFGRSNGIWIDCNTQSMHADGTPCEYTNFQNTPGDSDTDAGQGNAASCVQMYLYSGNWFAIGCSSVFFAICELPFLEESTEKILPSMVCMEFGADGRLHP
ncbi:pulmonary surfactant-associated protein A-like [Patiria miniata]|uniref:C-type lectin domain-containing protein n=1 Tax=Patiria miniata TaxID=46514 RepID=A0A914B252_PATMI|nr:pulmonary surfactant-associated protein A-like [Patiria miniata]